MTIRRGAAFALALACGGLTILAFPAPDIAPLAWVTPAGLILVCRGATLRRAAALGFVFGVGFFGLLLVWITIVGWFAWSVLVLVQAAYVALFGFLWAIVSRIDVPVTRVVGPPALWVACEWLRSNFPVHGFTWGVLDQSQHNLDWMLRAGTLGGGWLISFLVVLVAACLAEAAASLEQRGGLRAPVCLAVAALAVIAPLLIPSGAAQGKRIRVAIVQGDVPEGSAPGTRSTELAILRNHVDATRTAAAGDPDLVVWPESSIGLDPRRDPQVTRLLKEAARTAHAPMLVGADLDAGPGHYRVASLLVSPQGEIRDVYLKTHLVPYGEYAPFRAELSWLPALKQIPEDAIAAPHGRVLDVAGGVVAPVLSFENDFSSLVQRRIDLGGRLLVVGTNTSTWGRSWASAQHVAMTQVNAASNGVWAVHAALSGISAFVDPAGRVVSETPLFRTSTLVHEVSFARSVTFYARHGDWVAAICLGASALLIACGMFTSRNRSSKVASAA